MTLDHIYHALISRAQIRDHKRQPGFERHHIVPRSLGGTDAPSNLVWLTPREHWIIHKILWIRNPRILAYAKAFMWLHNLGKNSRSYQADKAVRSAAASARQKQRWQTDSQYRETMKNSNHSRSLDPMQEQRRREAHKESRRSSNKAKNVSIDGVVYRNVAEAAEVLEQNRHTLLQRVRNKNYPLCFFT